MRNERNIEAGYRQIKRDLFLLTAALLAIGGIVGYGIRAWQDDQEENSEQHAKPTPTPTPPNRRSSPTTIHPPKAETIQRTSYAQDRRFVAFHPIEAITQLAGIHR